MAIRNLPLALALGLWSSIATTTVAQSEDPHIRLVPAVSEVRWSGGQVAVPEPAAIVLSGQATPPERYAAELLRDRVLKRFGQKWPIHGGALLESSGTDTKTRVLIGLPRTHPPLDRLLKTARIEVPPAADGYALHVSVESGTVTIAVAGSNERGVVYGQDTLFQLLSKKDGKPVIQPATILDWPTIPLRGRPHTNCRNYLRPGELDCIMTSRINFIDLRNDTYAFNPGAKLDHNEIGKVISEARRRGLIVYGAVNCGIPTSEHEAALQTFKEFIKLGADALWVSFDDKGPGEAPREIVTRVLSLGREHGITGDRIAITPPKGSYQTIVTDFNRQIVAVPGMEKALWYWTSIPCAQDMKDAESIGLRTQPSWWHNWPRFNNPSLCSGGGRAYVPAPSLAEGWNHPSYEKLAESGAYVHAVLPWGGTGPGQYTIVPVIGWWSWRPEAHNFSAVRRRIYDIVFGPGQVRDAEAYDDTLVNVAKDFAYSASESEFEPLCPPRLASVGKRAEVLSKLEQLKKTVSALQAAAASGSLLDRDVVLSEYLEPMAREVEAGLAEAAAPYPEYWWDEHQRQVLTAVYDGNLAAADKCISGVRERLLRDITEVERLLKGCQSTRGYADWWRQRAGWTASDWQKLVEKRRAELQDRIADYGKAVTPTGRMLEGLGDPPTQWGTGPWERRNHVLATVLPGDREMFRGDWIAGIYRKGAVHAAVFALDRHTPVEAGNFCELPVEVPISPDVHRDRDRLALLIYLSDVNKESFGLGYAKWRWIGYRTMRLLWGEQKLWEADMGIPRTNGEWFIVNLPPLPGDLKTLSLRLRVEDHKYAKNNFEIAYVGPVRLIEVDRD